MSNQGLTAAARHVALLAPVPLEHLTDGIDVARDKGKVAFGSRVWQLFRQLDDLRKGMAVDVYVHASHTPGPPLSVVTWRGLYPGHVESVGGRHPDDMLYRPPSTAKYPSDNQGHWAVFWEVAELRELAPGERVRLTDLTGYGRRKPYQRTFVPEGPLLIEHP